MCSASKPEAGIFRIALSELVPSLVLMSAPAVVSPARIFSMALSSFIAISIPVPFTLPFPPVPSHLSVWYSFVNKRAMTKTGWYSDYRPRYSSDGDGTPRTVIPVSDKPSSPVWSIPVAAVKENILTNVRRIIHIGTGNHKHCRRRWYYEAGQGYRNITIDISITACR